MKPVIVLTFANDRDNYLEMIKREKRDILRAFRDHPVGNFVQVEHEGDAALDDIFYYFDTHKDKIVIFHYGGHASGTHLQLEMISGRSQQVKAEPLARVMGLQEELQLVFLNGCATRKQVGLLLDSGVKAVIATSVPIDDSMASEFAVQFYTSLASGRDIEGAFNMAKAKVTAPEGSSREIKIYSARDVNWQEKETPATDPEPWGLYYAEAHKNVLKWKLPPYRTHDSQVNECLEVNSYLIDTLSRATAPHNLKMAALMDENQIEKSKAETRKEIRREIWESMPLPLGEQLRRLFNNSTKDINRLKQLVQCHREAVKFLCFILLSQLWDEKIVNPSLAVNEDFLKLSKSLFEPGGDDYQTFDYINLIKIIAHIFKKNEIDYFAKEFSIIGESLMTQSENELNKALRFMEDLKREIDGCSINGTNEVNNSCSEAEKHLGIILEKVGFLVMYKLTSIKEIQVKKERHKDAWYLHTRVILKGRWEGLKHTKWKNDSCTDDNSVVLLKDCEGAARFLNLFPFVIDYNTIEGDALSRIYFFSHQDPSRGIYSYRSVETNETLNISVKEGDEIKSEYEKLGKQFEKFKEDVLNLK
ncbi:MAG: CHAT domain-containing protein [Candidatus Aminicenantes bacterium]|nr:MAG: CHAT domain-containing protein [Candidatus Aminicenantes bacterium]